MYSGTSLITAGSFDEVNRAILDLLSKINELSGKLTQLEKKMKDLENAVQN